MVLYILPDTIFKGGAFLGYPDGYHIQLGRPWQIFSTKGSCTPAKAEFRRHCRRCFSPGRYVSRVAAFGLFDQRLLHACEAGIQPALITENSKPGCC